jgi:hypothetical protein
MLETGAVEVLDDIHETVLQPALPEVIDDVQDPDWHRHTGG